MFLSLHGRESDVDGFMYFLATKLHKTVAELSMLPATEIMGWRSYWAVKSQAEELARKVVAPDGI